MSSNTHLIIGHGGNDHVTADDFRHLIGSIFDNGKYVIPEGTNFKIDVVSNNEITIGTGAVIMNGSYIRVESSENIRIDNGVQSSKRNDLIVLRYTIDKSTKIEDANVVVIKGTQTTSTPADPSYNNGSVMNGDTTVDIPLYRIPLDGLNIQTPVKLFNLYDSGYHKTFIVDKLPSTLGPDGTIYLVKE